ncbi:hypothetical protein DPX16_20391 [Anabarilius grahami]|uniref:Uncharacterized protein n=1 Tax=Anabarilius grahami TaxID=495550 RepID=A0A3N0XI80_ANAGA|nr:hypothetical protein DPX16_20391 [Anabarilius grahami]
MVNTLMKQTVMEGTSTVLQLYKTIREKNKLTKFLPVNNGPGSVTKERAALKGKALISSGMKEVGPKTEREGLDKTNEVRNKVLFEDLLDPTVDCKTEAIMGNQQGNKNSDLESNHGSGVDLCCTSSLEHKLIISPKSLRKASRGRKEKKLRMMSSRGVERRTPMSTTEPLSNKVLKNAKRQCEHECPKTLTELKNKAIAKDSKSFEEDLSSELSEYDNGIDSDETQNTHGRMKTTKQEKSQTTDMIQPYRCENEGMEQQEATSRVRDKIVEVDNVIHQVFCTSLDCLRGSTHASTADGFLHKDSHIPTQHMESFPLELSEVLKQTNIKSGMKNISFSSSDAVAAISTSLHTVSPPLSRISSQSSKPLPQYRILPLPEVDAEDHDRIYLYGSTERSTYNGSVSAVIEQSVSWTPSSTTIPTSPTIGV